MRSSGPQDVWEGRIAFGNMSLVCHWAHVHTAVLDRHEDYDSMCLLVGTFGRAVRENPWGDSIAPQDLQGTRFGDLLLGIGRCIDSDIGISLQMPCYTLGVASMVEDILDDMMHVRYYLSARTEGVPG
jgi:hypothetical protein